MHYCSAWCLVDDSKCLITNFIISPQEGLGLDSDQICYSNRKAGNHILTATATGSLEDYGRVPSIMTNGICNYDHWKTVTVIKGGPNPYMLFEFQSEVEVRIIRFAVANYSPQYPSDKTEIRLGSSMPGLTDFSQLDLIGTFGYPKSNYEMKTFNVEPPIKAKFLAILETDETFLSFCFIEVLS